MPFLPLRVLTFSGLDFCRPFRMAVFKSMVSGHLLRMGGGECHCVSERPQFTRSAFEEGLHAYREEAEAEGRSGRRKHPVTE